MPLDQYAAFVQLLPAIETELARKGQKVPRPEYRRPVPNDGAGGKEEEGGDLELSDAGDEGGGPIKKSNIEATSDEDED